MDDLVRWLGEQLAADERIARAAGDEFGFAWTVDDDAVSSEINYVSVVEEPGSPTAFIAAHDPARVLREIDAKRQVIARYEFAAGEAARLALAGEEHEVWVQVGGALQACLLCLATPYADRPGYAEALASAE